MEIHKIVGYIVTGVITVAITYLLNDPVTTIVIAYIGFNYVSEYSDY